MQRSSRRGLVALLLAFLATSLPAAAQQPERLGVQITPATTEFDLNQRTFKAVATVTNQEDGPRRVFLRVTGLGHDLDGSPLLVEPAVATDAIELSATRFMLQPEESRRITLQGRIPDGHRGVYAVLVARYEAPTDEADEGETQVNVRTQVAASYLLRGPRPWNQSVEVIDVSILPGAPRGPFQVYAAVRNIGNVHVKPSGRIEIFKDGESIGTVLLPNETIVPGFARRLIGTWDPKEKLTGRLTLEATIRDPNATGVGEVDFTEGTLRAVTAEIVGIVVQEEQVIVSYRNTGTAVLTPEIEFSAAAGDVEVTADSVPGEEVAPGDVGEIRWSPVVDAGLYVVTAQLLADGELLDQDVAGLEVAGSDIRPLIFGAIGVALLVLLVVFAVVYRRRHPREARAAKATRRKKDVLETPAGRPVSDPDAGLAAVEAAKAAAEAALQAAQAAQDAAAALSVQRSNATDSAEADPDADSDPPASTR